MSRTPAAHLARLKVEYQSWSIRELPEGNGFRADGRPAPGTPWRNLVALTLDDLEIRLREASGR